MSNEIEITQNGASVSEIAQPKSESSGLWCIYIAGPDDLVAMPTKALAEAVARNFNAVWDRYGAERGHNVRAVAHAEPWMHGKEAHAKDLREHFHEYADLVLDEEAPASADPARPVEAVDERVAFEAWAIANGFDVLRYEGVDEYHWLSTITAWNAWKARAALAHPRPTGDECRVAPVEQERFEAWMKRSGANIRKRPDGVYADHTVMCCWNSWLMSAGFKTDTSLTTVPYALADVVRAVRRFDECAEDGEDVDLGRDWLDALTTLGLLIRVQRSPARWEMTDAGHSLLALPAPTVELAGEVTDVMVEAALQAYVSESGTVDTRGDDLLPINHEGMRAALTTSLAHPRPVGVPDGYKIVPVKAMREITEAGRKSLIESSKANVTYDTTAAYAYEEMVAAAPAPAKAGGA